MYIIGCSFIIFTNNIICFIDDKYEIPISCRSYLAFHLIIAANEAAITKLNGDSTVEGSVDKKIADNAPTAISDEELDTILNEPQP